MWKRILTCAKGFGLLEVMVAAAMAGGLALVVAKIQQDMTKVNKTAETSSEINQFMADVSYILSDRDNCNATIPSNTAPGNALTRIQRLTDTGTPQIIYQTSPDASPIRYGNNTFSLKEMTVEKDSSTGAWTLIIILRRESDMSVGVRELKKEIPLEVVELPSGNIDQCFTNTDTIITSAVKQACGMNSGGSYIADSGATQSTTYYDPVLKACISALEPRLCAPGKVLVEAKVEGNNEIRFTCEDVIRNPITCSNPGYYVKGINAAGEVDCQPLNTAAGCGTGQYAINVSNGQMVCADFPKCNPQQILIATSSGVLQCKNVPCNTANQYMAGIDGSGNIICKTFPDKTCGAGQYIKEVKNDGTVVCDFVPLQENLTKVDYSFIDGYNRATNTVSRKSISQTAQQICGYFNGFTWSGSKCLQPTLSTRNIYSDKDGFLRLSGGSDSTTVNCSNCGSGCTPGGCPAGYADHGHSCSMGGNCGWHRWRNCQRVCVRTRPVEGKLISP